MLKTSSSVKLVEAVSSEPRDCIGSSHESSGFNRVVIKSMLLAIYGQ